MAMTSGTPPLGPPGIAHGIADGGTTSIRLRLVIGCLTATATAICLAGVFVYRIVDAGLMAAGTDELRAVLLGGSVRAAAESNHLNVGSGESEGLFAGQDAGYHWLVRRPGMDRAKAMSGSFPTEGLPLIDVGSKRETEPFVYQTTGANGELFRVAGYCFTPADNVRRDRGGPRREPPQDGWGGQRRRPPPDRGGPPAPGGFSPNERFDVFVAASIADEVATLENLKRTLLASGAAALLVSFLGLLLVVRRSLAPLQALSRRVAEVDESTLGEPIELPDVALELAPIVSAFDSTRERLNSAFERERRFTADAAHELRTPLAGLRAVLEVVLRRERSLQEHREAAKQCLEVTESMQGMVEALLSLARREDASASAGPVEIAEVLGRAFRSVEASMSARSLVLVRDFDGSQSYVVHASPVLVERILSNIASNAAEYADHGTPINAVIQRADDGALSVQVSNECSALPGDIASAAFEPFWRADASRTGEGQHVGLGLALVAKAAEAMGATVTIETLMEGDAPLPDAAGKGVFQVTLGFPAP